MKLTLATIAVNQTPLDWSGNLRRIQQACEKVLAAGSRPGIILTGELSLSGYGCEDAFHADYTARRAAASLYSLADWSRNYPSVTFLAGLPVRYASVLYNTMAVVRNGQIRALIPKQHLAGDGIHYEPRWFQPYRGKLQKIIPDHFYSEVSFGPAVFEQNKIRFAVEICEDFWVFNRPAVEYTKTGLDLILGPSASHFATGKLALRRNIAIESSRRFQCVFASVNLLGNESGRAIYDGSSIVAGGGVLLFEDSGFSYADSIVRLHELDFQAFKTARTRTSSHTDSLKQESKTEVIVLETENTSPAGFRAGSHRPEPPTKNINILTRKMEPLDRSAFEEVTDAVCLGLFDYLRKSHSKGFSISLSGGADSAACALFAERMVRKAVTELGLRETAERLNLKGVPAIEKNLVNALITTVYQATRQSSDVTRNAAAELAAELRTNHHVIEIDAMVDSYIQHFESTEGRSLNWESDDITLQNIQARARSPMIWMFANAKNHLLLTTGNRSEAAVGYATMDGDTSGGLAPIAGISKDFLRELLIWFEKTGDRFGKVASLKAINDQQPTAELRPSESHQTDEEDLMPYWLLNRIETASIRDGCGPVEVCKRLYKSKDEDPARQEKLQDLNFLKQSIRKFFRLWAINQWKRERLAVSFHLDDRNLDPRSWYRFPVLNSGFTEELQELDDFTGNY